MLNIYAQSHLTAVIEANRLWNCPTAWCMLTC